MSHKADIDKAFDELLEEIPTMKGEILTCKFSVYESLEWDDAAKDVVLDMEKRGLGEYVEGWMRVYIEN